jgi:Kef-type K+ transport system membrane component KefB
MAETLSSDTLSIEMLAPFMIGALVFLSLVVRNLFEKVHVPALVGYIVLGIALGLIDERTQLLGETGRTVLDVLGSIGIVALLFRVGVESDLGGLVSKLRQAVPIWLGSVIVAGASAFATAWWLLNLDWIASLFVGVAATATSVGVSVGVWQDARAMRTENGERLLDVAEMDDISGVALLALLIAVVPVLQGSGGAEAADGAALSAVGSAAGLFALKLAAFSLFCFLLSRYGEAPAVGFFQKRMSRTDLTVLVASVGIMIAATAEMLGLSIAIGALFAGFVFSRDSKRVKENRAYTAFLDLFAPFFFIAIGANFETGSLTQSLGYALPLFLVLVLGKLIGTGAPAIPSAGKEGAVLIGVSMVPRAEIAMIVMERGRQTGLVSDAVFGAMLIASIATCILAPIALQILFRRWPQRQ